MRFLITGQTGQLGFELRRSLSVLGEVIALDRHAADLAKPDTLPAIIRRHAPDVIVNAAAYTAVDKAENEPGLARQINAMAPAILAEEAARLDAVMVHFSTDYVFDGRQPTPYAESDTTHPLSIYGQSKLEGEQAVRSATPRHLIFRTSWVYGAYGNNFLKTMLRLLQTRQSLSVVDDQHGAPTAASLIADTCAQILARLPASQATQAEFPFGTYHLSAAGSVSWHGYAHHIATQASRLGYPLTLSPDNILAIPTSAYPLPAPRPANSLLDTSLLRTTFGLALPDWREGVEQTLALLKAGRAA
ncbi:MAG: dTDP-4-dehydrorhamnose reductase [Corticimicrobacter sp.]|uniref:dTDP-4-dehydrorhamnose reductase n=1 Tax=Corticimicrobacter sp. TaxID=2678536 RepID=UPI0032DB1F00